MFRVNELIVETFGLIDRYGNRVTTGASFPKPGAPVPTMIALDPDGVDISSQITPLQIGTTGVYTYRFTPLKEGLYYISIYEPNTGQYIISEYKIGGPLEDRLWSLANQGQTVGLTAGGGGLVFIGTLTTAGVAAPNTLVRAYTAQDTTGPDINAVTDLTTVIATTTTDSGGNFTMFLQAGYYTLVWGQNNINYQQYLRWKGSPPNWVTSSSPIAP